MKTTGIIIQYDRMAQNREPIGPKHISFDLTDFV